MNFKTFFFMFIAFAINFGSIFPQSYKVAGSINIGGEGRWDYLSVDNANNKLYVSHQTRVHVIDLKNNKVIAEISGLSGVHGIAFAPEAGKGFITNGTTNSITVFDLKTYKTLDSIKVNGTKPDAVVYEPFTKRIFSFNAGSNNATAIDPATNKIVGEVKFDGNPEYAASDKKGKMFVNIEDKSMVVEFDPKTCEVLAKWPLTPLEEPTGMGIDIKNNLLFVTGANQLMSVMDYSSGKVISTLPIGKRVDGCAFDAEKGVAFSSNGEGSMTIIKEKSPKDFAVIQTLATVKGARTITLDTKTHKVYTITQIEQPDKTQSFGVLIIEPK